MEALLVGADRLGNIPGVLADFGIRIRQHVSGREKSHQRKGVVLPRGIAVVILFTDFLGHNVMKSFREAAAREGVRLVACRRSTCSLRQALESNKPQQACQQCPHGLA